MSYSTMLFLIKKGLGEATNKVANQQNTRYSGKT